MEFYGAHMVEAGEKSGYFIVYPGRALLWPTEIFVLLKRLFGQTLVTINMPFELIVHFSGYFTAAYIISLLRGKNIKRP